MRFIWEFSEIHLGMTPAGSLASGSSWSPMVDRQENKIRARTEGLAWDVEVMPPFPERCQHCYNLQSESFGMKKRKAFQAPKTRRLCLRLSAPSFTQWPFPGPSFREHSIVLEINAPGCHVRDQYLPSEKEQQALI